VTLFYLYTPVSLPLEPVAEWQRALCTRLGLLGRARIAEEGINATFAGSQEAIDAYVEAMRTEGPPAPHPDSTRSPPLFARTAFKFSLSDTLPFAGLGMFIVPELTASGKMGKSKPPGLQEQQQPQAGAAATAAAASGSDGASAAAAASTAERSSSLHLTPAEFHDALSNFDPETTLLLDTRNAYETAVGTFEHAVDPKLRAFHQLPEFISQNLPAIRSKKKVLMFCTGGVRCEKASLYLAHRAGPDTQVLQLEGGIHKYLDAFPDGGHFKGKNFVFDARLAMAPSEHAPPNNNNSASANAEDKAAAAKDAVVGHCVHCGVTDDFLSEAISCAVCKSFVILCAGCRALYADKKWNYFCTEHMLLTAAEGAPEIEHMKRKQPHNKRQKRGEQQEQTVEGDAAAASPSPSPSPSASSPDSATSASSSAAASASPSPAAAAISDDSVTAASNGGDVVAAATGVAASPSPSLSCLEQWHSFLRRFSLRQLEGQLAEIDAILAYFASAAQRKAKSRSANRKQNLHVQRKRLAAYIVERRAAAAADPNSADAAAVAAAAGESKEQQPVVSTVAPPQFLSFVPFLNV
jgi:predicted sulfurtransferase